MKRKKRNAPPKPAKERTQVSKNNRKNTLATTSLKASVSLAGLTAVLYHSGPKKVLATITSINTAYMAAAVALFIASVYISSIRWNYIIPGKITRSRAFSLCMIGSFYNNILPGAVSGDAVKAYHLYKETRQPSLAAASVFADRYIGFLALFAIAMATLPFALAHIKNNAIRLAVPSIVALFAAATTIVYIYKPGSKYAPLHNFYGNIARLSSTKAPLLRAFLVSFPIQACSILITYCAAEGLQTHIPLTHLCTIVPIIATITLIPITISGIGIREALFVTLLAPVKIMPAQATAISLATFAVTFIGSLPGLYYAGTNPSHTQGSAPEPMPAIEQPKDPSDHKQHKKKPHGKKTTDIHIP